MSTLVARLTADQATHELLRVGDAYVLRTYVAAAPPPFDRELSVREAGQLVDLMRRGGDVFMPLGFSLTTTEGTTA